LPDQNLSSVDKSIAAGGKALFDEYAANPGGDLADAGGTDQSLDAFDVIFAEQVARNARDALRIDPEDQARLHSSDQAQHFHGDGDVELTIVENRSHRLAKSFVATVNGMAIEKGRPPFTGFGRMVRATLSKDRSIARLARLLEGLKETQALMVGQLPGSAPMRRMIVKDRWLTLSEADRDREGDGPVYRGGLFKYVPGQPALLMIDHDGKDLPDELRERIEQEGGLRAVLATIDPQWEMVGFLHRPSSSTGVRDKRTGVTTPDSGWHYYTIVEDGGDVGRYIKVLADRLTLAGFGFVMVSNAGSLLERGPIDLAASGVPYWLTFEANAVLEAGAWGDHLEHVPDARTCKGQEGPRLDTSLLADLSDEEQHQVAVFWASMKGEKEPKARSIKLARGAQETERLVKMGVPRADAERLVLARADTSRLSLDGEYWFDVALPSGKRSATGWELLEGAEAWFGGGKRKAADPLEPGYPGTGGIGKDKAVWRLNEQGPGLFVFSQAHQGQKFLLAYDAEHIVELMAEMKAGGASALVRLARLKVLYRHYLPADPGLAETVLSNASLPAPAVLAFGGSDETDTLADARELGELARERLIAALKAEDWDRLWRLRCYRAFRDEALAELRAEDEDDPFGDTFGFPVQWDMIASLLLSRDRTDDGGVVTDVAETGTREDLDTDPIVPVVKPQAHYPVGALPGLFGAAVQAAARVCEVDPSMSGTVGIAAVATAVGKLAPGVEAIGGQILPGSIYSLVIAPSSERKTSIDGRMFEGIRRVETGELAREHADARKAFDVDTRLHEHRVRSILSRRGHAARRQAQAESGEGEGGSVPSPERDDLLQLAVPEPPKSPTIITAEATVEGLRDLLATGHGLVGVVSSEGAVVLAGHSLGRQEGKSASAGTYASLWDGRSFNTTRAGRTITVMNPRVSASLGVQPRVAARFFQDEDLADQGLTNRVLVSWPTPQSGLRRLALPASEDLAVLQRFNDRLADRLRRALGVGFGLFGDPPRQTPLRLAPDAEALRQAFAHEMEAAQRAGERFEFARGMAAKAAEQAVRIALVLELFEEPDASKVGASMMRAGVALARWHADEWVRVTSVPAVPKLNASAVRVLEWLTRRYAPGGKTFTARDVYTSEAGGVRSRKGADRVLSLLAQLGHIEHFGSVPASGGRPPLFRWRLPAGGPVETANAATIA
jgi:hypothetical protein